MLKKPSALRVPSASAVRGVPPPPGSMEVESTRVETLADGKKLIDVTMRRTSQPKDITEKKLVVPQFDDDDSSSSDDEEDNLRQYESPVQKKISLGPGTRAQENDDANYLQGCERDTGFQGDFQWSGVQDIQTLTHANAVLQDQVGELKDQIKTLQIQIEALAPVPGFNASAVQDILLDKGGSDHDIRDAKIVHQAKTLRHLKRSSQRDKQLAVDAVKQCKAMEVEKCQFEKENETLKLKLARFQARAAAVPNTMSVEDAPSTQETATTKEKETVNLYKKKYEDMRIKHDKLASDLKKTQRALIKEVGEDVPLEELVDGTSAGENSNAKRGRAQQIIMLKAKVKKLEQELGKANQSTGQPNETGSQDVDQRAQQEISGHHAQRQRVIDKLTVERDDLQERIHQLTRRYDGLKSRSQTLEKEKQEHKNKLQVLVDKSRNDDALVDALQKQLETWKSKLDESKRARTAESSSLPKDERMELDRLRTVVNDYKRQQTSTSMPATSEMAQYRTIAAEKERLGELVKTLQFQLDEKERQLKSQQLLTGSEASRIPRLTPGMKTSTPPVSQYYPVPPPAIESSSNTDALRKSFRESMAAKEHEIESLKAQLAQVVVPSEAAEEIQDLQEENQYLRQEFDRLKTRYEAVVKNTRKPAQ